jgi:hypothetical protein
MQFCASGAGGSKALKKTRCILNAAWTPYTNMHLKTIASCKHLRFPKLFS